MNPLTQNIINRIQIARKIPQQISNISATYAPINSADLSLKVNRAIMKFLSNTKKKEKQRVSNEGELLNDIKNLRFLTTSTIEEVYQSTLQIFAFYDQSFLTFNESGKAVQDSLKNLYLSFFYKYQSKISAKYIFRMISHHITQSTPFILLGWVSEWSRNYFSEQVQSVMQNQISRHQQQMKKASNTRHSSIAAVRDKVVAPINPNMLMRSEQPAQEKQFTNKQSVYGLFLDELIQYYKFLPLDLDFNFLKAMRKVHSKHNKLEVEQNLRRAAQILIQSKNKNIRDQIKQYNDHYRPQIQINPKQMKQIKPPQSKQKILNRSASPQHKMIKSVTKKPTLQQKFFERAKTQSKEEDQSLNQLQKRKSLLLYPKANKISFESSQEIMRKIHYQRQKKIFQLPLIHHSNRILSDNIRSSILKNNHAFSPINHSIISNYEKGIIKHFVIASKKSEVKSISIQKYQKISSSEHAVRQIVQNVHLKKLKGDKRKRKLMLEILRQNNKNVFLDQ